MIQFYERSLKIQHRFSVKKTLLNREHYMILNPIYCINCICSVSVRSRNKQKLKGGAVKGHKGHFRKPSDHVDRIAISKISQCQYCGSRDLNERSFHSFHQIDIPEIKSLVTRP